ncbi:MAG: Hydroxymethylpyrimidine/phosphomethylpyrimidine kinase [Syntrophus sp. PtaU1.Bin005]|jgi:hydroxymethylpyrimidine/phosphomethylpyrimidine kinase|uniref:bifunctional hydroxymethylpyrimidine kinase/phosphomethylpyrimidine kinase n=1 Tax=Syntrophus TaxID=43773 RepID=UPI0009CDD077|nr:MAG: Hydroxymethylpyrimidine/phosphomethylpyrimidine kinase [Syntrophus sp. PtaB.Bin138]OPY83240.1 MAG: Hydroxymethylpyrimidine/phosphomethylpyrimidine kinase [Syntrophus sp. PtaU1.Bin005]
MERKPARVLTIAGSDSGGGAGIQADLKTITVLGGFGMSVITALTAQNTLGVQGIFEVPIPFIEQQFDSVATDIGVDAAKTGMLVNSAVIRAVAAKIRRYGIERLVVDPVMVAKGGVRLIRDEALDSLVSELIPLALVVTPNVPEAEVLAGMAIGSVEDMKKAARNIRELGVPNVIVKGGHLTGPATDILFDGSRFYEFTSERIATTDCHGTGCTYSAAIATALARGTSLLESIREAKAYISKVIRFAWHIGQGHGPTNHAAPFLMPSTRFFHLSIKDDIP